MATAHSYLCSLATNARYLSDLRCSVNARVLRMMNHLAFSRMSLAGSESAKSGRNTYPNVSKPWKGTPLPLSAADGACRGRITPRQFSSPSSDPGSSQRRSTKVFTGRIGRVITGLLTAFWFLSSAAMPLRYCCGGSMVIGLLISSTFTSPLLTIDICPEVISSSYIMRTASGGTSG